MTTRRYSDDFVEVCQSVETGALGRIGLGGATCATIGVLTSWTVGAVIFALWCCGTIWEVIAFKRFTSRLESKTAEAHMLASVFANMCVTIAPVIVCVAEKELGLALAAGFYASATTLFLIILFGRYKTLLAASITPCALAVLISTLMLVVHYIQQNDVITAIGMLFLPLCYTLIGLLPHLTLRHRDRQLEALVKEAETQRIAAEQHSQEADRQRQQAQTAKREAEMASLAKSEFLASMSHEIRTPMNGIIGMADLMMRSELTSSQKQFAEIIQTSGQSLLVIINDILDFSKLEAREIELHPEPFKVRELVRAVATLLGSSIDTPDLRIEYWIDPKIPETLFGDGARLRQILLNLAGNAIKFTKKGHVRIIVRLHPDLSDTYHAGLGFSVEDTGIGIAEDDIDRMFEKFSQADSGTTRIYGGTGLGLAICKELVTLLSGQIWATSHQGVGSTFSFEVPIALSDIQNAKTHPMILEPSSKLPETA